MKRIVAMAILLALVFSGCGGEPPVQESEPEAAPAATVLGRVSRISGNDIALTLGTYGTGAATMDSGTPKAEAAPMAEAAPKAEAASPAEAQTTSRTPRGTGGTGGAGGTGGTGGAGGTGGTGGTGGAGNGADVKFRESGTSWTGRIPVGTSIAYGALTVDFSLLQPGYIVSLTLGGADGQTVVSGEILSTS